MEKELVVKTEIKLVGLSVRTNNKCEMNPQTAKISGLVSMFCSQNYAAQLPHRKNPGVTFSVYTDYESDEYGDYTYFIGEEVTSLENMPPEFKKLTIPASKYVKFTTGVGKMPEVVVNAWQEIWKMTPTDFGGHRVYQADFEVYDDRASDPAKTSVDIYIGII